MSAGPAPRPPTTNGPRCPRPDRVFVVGLASAVVVAMVVTLLSTRHGIATASDSARYVRTARIWLGSERAVETPGLSKSEQAHFPPFYSAALAAGGFLTRQDPLVAARWVHVLIFATTTLLVGVLVRWCSRGVGVSAGLSSGPIAKSAAAAEATQARAERLGHQWRGSASDDSFDRVPAHIPAWPAVLAAMVIALSPVTVTAHAWLASEALFITFALLTILLVAKFIDRPRCTLLIAAAVATSLGILTRYAGAAMGPAIVAALLLLPPASGAPTRSWRRRWIDVILFGVVALALPLLWVVRNIAVGGSATNRTLAWHPVSLGHVKDGVASVATWLLPLGIDDARNVANGHPILAAGAVLLFSAVCVAGCSVAWRRRREPVGRMAALALLTMSCFVGLLVVSISLADFIRRWIRACWRRFSWRGWCWRGAFSVTSPGEALGRRSRLPSRQCRSGRQRRRHRGEGA